jgi:hypothetical protein
LHDGPLDFAAREGARPAPRLPVSVSPRRPARVLNSNRSSQDDTVPSPRRWPRRPRPARPPSSAAGIPRRR